MQKTAKRKPKRTDAAFRVTLTMGAYVFDSAAPTLIEAIEGVLPDFVKGYSVITVAHNGFHAEAKLFAIQLRRLMVNKIARQLLEKRLTVALH